MSQLRASYNRKRIVCKLGSGVTGPKPEEVEYKRKPKYILADSDPIQSPWKLFMGWGRRFFGNRSGQR